jgi:outer membrane protein OmpA-like peptidoglycan-associated protein
MTVDAMTTSEEQVQAPFAGIRLNQKFHCALLAGTMLMVLPQAGVTLDTPAAPSATAIILAQAIDPATGKPYQKGAPAKGAPAPKGPPPGGPPSQGSSQGVPQQMQKGPPPQTIQQGGGGQPLTGQQGVPQRLQKGPPPQQTIQQGGGGQPLTGQQGVPQRLQKGPPPQTIQQGGSGEPLTGQQGVPQRLQKGPPPQTTQQGGSGQPLSGQQGVPQRLQKGPPPQTIQQGGSGQPLSGPQGVQPLQQGLQPKGPGQPGIQQGTPLMQPIPGGTPPGQRQFGQQPPQGVQPLHVDQLRSQRHERREAGGAIVIEEPGRRFIVREHGRAFIRHDDSDRFRRWGGEPRLERRGVEQYAYVSRPGGYQIITVTDSHGRMLRRIRRGPDGREVILLENRYGPVVGVLGAGLAAGVILALVAPAITIPREHYIVDVSAAPVPLLYETLEAPPLVAIERPYSLDEVRYNVALRDRMRRIDIDSITFATGSWEVTPEQQPKLAAVADAIRRVLARHPDEIFMVEGHTDAVGTDVDNLSLSDRRAESIAVILTEHYQIPPENLVTQGYGEQHLKVPTEGPSRENRRVSLRRVTPLLQGGVASR